MALTQKESTGNEYLDVATIIKAAQTLSREVHLPALLKQIMKIIMENAGATRAVFMTADEATLLVQGKAAITADSIETMMGVPVRQFQELPQSIINYTARTKTNLVIHNVLQDKSYATDPYIHMNRPVSILCMPMRHLGKLSGILYLENNLTEGAFTPERIQILEVLSSQAAISLENASLYETLEKKVHNRTALLKKALEALWGEMELAKKIQTALTPKQPDIKGYDIAASLRPAKEVGGDYYDIIHRPENDWLVIGDVTGHGISAGLIMMMVQTSIHTLLDVFPDATPSMVLSAVNKTIYKNIKRLNESKHMTMVILSATGDGCLTFAGRHDDMIVWRDRTRRVETIKTTGMWIGITPDISSYLQDATLQLEKGDCLLLYTDGITEARNTVDDRLFGGKRLEKTLESLGGLAAQDVHDGILKAMEDYTAIDDIALIVAKRTD